MPGKAEETTGKKPAPVAGIAFEAEPLEFGPGIEGAARQEENAARDRNSYGVPMGKK